MLPFQFQGKVESLKNPLVKEVAQLKEGKARRKSGTFAIEGAREIARAILSGFELQTLLVCKEKISDKTNEELEPVKDRIASLYCIEISKDVFHKLAMRESHDGLIAVAKTQALTVNDLNISSFKLVLVVEAVEKPGNLGALLRTADGAGVDLVIVADSPIDEYSPNTIRASLGAVFSLPILHTSAKEAFTVLNSNNFQIVAADPYASIKFFDCKFTGATAVVLGSEADGLSSVWKSSAELVGIPMRGICDSLNVSVSGALMLYEVVRQTDKS